jgi:hypothetical protein
MANAKKRTTMAKHARDQAVRARRLEKQAKKDARKAARDAARPATERP